MDSFTIHSVESAPVDSRAALEGIVKKYGFLPNLAGVMAESPATLTGFMGLASAFDSDAATLSPHERQVVLLTVSVFNECSYCAAAHTMLASKLGVSRDTVEAVRNGEAIQDRRLEAVRSFTLALVENRGWVTEGTIEAFLSAGFTRAQVLEVILGASLKTLTNYVNHLARPPLNAPFAAYALPPRAAVR